MSILSSMEDTIKEHFSSGGQGVSEIPPITIDAGKVLAIVEAIIQAAPAIEEGLMSAAPFVEALVEMISNGGTPSDDQWTLLKAKLDAGSVTLAEAEAEAQSEIDAELPDDPADNRASGLSGASGVSGPSGVAGAIDLLGSTGPK